MNIEKKIVVLTGATGGLGQAFAKALVKKRAIVYGIGRNIQILNDLKNELGYPFHPIQLDISNEENVKSWINSTFNDTMSPDILINNAGVGLFSKIENITSSKWLEMINTNLNGMFYITSNIVPFLKSKKESSHIINIGSILGKTGRNESSAYSATKFGVQGFSESLFLELRSFNIKVTCINPGSIETGFFAQTGIKSHKNMLQTTDLANTLIHILETPDNMLINDITIRPLNPMAPAN